MIWAHLHFRVETPLVLSASFFFRYILKTARGIRSHGKNGFPARFL